MDASKSNTPLHMACNASDIEAVKELLAGGADTCALNRYKESPLSIAIRKKNAAIIKLLVDHNALKANREVSCPFLVHLPDLGDLELFEYVLSRGNGLVDINDCDDEGRSAFHYALYKGHEKILLLIITSGFNLNRLFVKSAKRKDYFYVKGSIDHGMGLINVNYADEYGNTALHYAAANRDPRMVQLLAASGADRQLENKEGKTPAMLIDDSRIKALLS